MNKAIYPGSFDPPTYGHLDIIERASAICDKLFVVIGNNINKKYTFSALERKSMLQESIKHLDNVEIVIVEGLLTDYCLEHEISLMIRGLRAISDFDYEFQLATTNRFLSDKIETVFLMSKPSHTFLSSSQAKEIAKYGGNLSHFVPNHIEVSLINKLK